MEKKYDFKLDLLAVHKRGVRIPTLLPTAEEFEISDGFALVLPKEADEVVLTAAADFIDYLFVSHGVGAMRAYTADRPSLRISYCREPGEAAGYMGYRITVGAEGIILEGYDSRGIAQGLYSLEDRMNLRRAPFLNYGTVARRARFSSRRTSSPFGMLEYNDAALSLIAHYGMDTIDLWLNDPYTTQRKDYIDIRLLSERAARYGLDVAILMRAPHDKHPSDPGAQEYYDAMYGELLTVCPRIKYIKVIGETTKFKSHDPATSPTQTVDGIPTGKPTPGWWPCRDYPEWLSMILRAIRKHSKTAELIFGTYNWGYAPEEERLRLIRELPSGIILEATFDMYEKRRIGESVGTVPDYSLTLPGPGAYFVSEARAACERGDIGLAANAQASGRTWDFGVIPYEPMPGMWIRRYEALVRAQEEWGLAHIMENIHYGFYPSFIMDLEKEAFFTGGVPLEDLLDRLLVRDFEENARTVREACRLLDEAITHYMPTNEDQYTAYRIGPAYPLAFDPFTGKRAARDHAMFGNAIYRIAYIPDTSDQCSPSGIRLRDELREGELMRDLLAEAPAVLDRCESPNRKLRRLHQLVEFMYRSVLTALAGKRLHLLKTEFSTVGTRERAAELLDEIEALLLAERKNVEATIPIVQLDSRLGWEPSMEYSGGEDALLWKLRQLDHEIYDFIPKMRRSNDLILKY